MLSLEAATVVFMTIKMDNAGIKLATFRVELFYGTSVYES
jgi:hypothetical protein